MPLSFFLTSSSLSGARLLVHSFVFFSLLSSLSFFLSTLSGLPLRLRQRSTLFDPSPLYASKGLSDSSFILPSYFTYLLTLGFFLPLHRFFIVSFFLSASLLCPSLTSLLFHILDCYVGNRAARYLELSEKQSTAGRKERREREKGRRDDERHFSSLLSSFLFFLCFIFLLSHASFSCLPSRHL